MGRCGGIVRALVVVLAAHLALPAIAPAAPEGTVEVRAAKPKEPKEPTKPVRGRTKRAPREFFGIQSIAPMSAGEFAAAREGGLGTYRAVFSWPVVESTPGARRWDYTDYQVSYAARHGLTLLPVLYGTAAHAGSHPLQPPFGLEARPSWTAFVEDAVRRYGPGGEFWRRNPDVPYQPISRWQVWNEQSSRAFWDGSPNAREYATLVKATAIAVRHVDPGAEILLGGILPHRGDPGGQSFNRYLRRLYRVPGIKRHFDGVALHPYTASPNRVLALADDVRSLVTRKRDKGVDLWITELGWASSGSAGPAVTTPSGQAGRLIKTYRSLLFHRSKLRLRGVVWHMWRDVGIPAYSGFWAYNSGLFNADGSSKPAWAALTRITRGRPAAIVEPPSPPPPSPPPPENDPCFLIVFC